MRALHFGPSLSTTRISAPPVTLPVASKPAHVKADTAAQQSSSTSTSTTSAATAQESHGTPIPVPTDSKQIAPHTVPVPVPPAASISAGTTNTPGPGPGTSIPETAAPHAAPLSLSDTPGSVWGAKRSFLDVSTHQHNTAQHTLLCTLFSHCYPKPRHLIQLHYHPLRSIYPLFFTPSFYIPPSDPFYPP